MKKIILLVCTILIAVSVNAEDQKVADATRTYDKNRPSTVAVSEIPATTNMAVTECCAKTYQKDQILTLVRVGKVNKKDVEDAKAWIEKSIYPPISVNVKAINLLVHRLFQHRDTWRTCVLICETHKMLGMLVHLGMRDWGLFFVS
jgi:hypothetical protein